MIGIWDIPFKTKSTKSTNQPQTVATTMQLTAHFFIIFFLFHTSLALQLHHLSLNHNHNHNHNNSPLNPSSSPSSEDSAIDSLDRSNFILPLTPIGYSQGNEVVNPFTMVMPSTPSSQDLEQQGRQSVVASETQLVRGDQVSQLPNPNPLPQQSGIPVTPN